MQLKLQKSILKMSVINDDLYQEMNYITMFHNANFVTKQLSPFELMNALTKLFVVSPRIKIFEALF